MRSRSAEGDIPARMAVSVKQLDDRADDDELTRQLSSFVTAIFTQFDRYEIGNLITDVPFMGKTAYSTIYRGYKGDQVIEGMAILTGVGTKIYAYHFSCAAEDYDAMAPVRGIHARPREANNANIRHAWRTLPSSHWPLQAEGCPADKFREGASLRVHGWGLEQAMRRRSGRFRRPAVGPSLLPLHHIARLRPGPLPCRSPGSISIAICAPNA